MTGWMDGWTEEVWNVHAGGGLYRCARARDEQSGAVAERAHMINGLSTAGRAAASTARTRASSTGALLAADYDASGRPPRQLLRRCAGCK